MEHPSHNPLHSYNNYTNGSEHPLTPFGFPQVPQHFFGSSTASTFAALLDQPQDQLAEDITDSIDPHHLPDVSMFDEIDMSFLDDIPLTAGVVSAPGVAAASAAATAALPPTPRLPLLPRPVVVCQPHSGHVIPGTTKFKVVSTVTPDASNSIDGATIAASIHQRLVNLPAVPLHSSDSRARESILGVFMKEDLSIEHVRLLVEMGDGGKGKMYITKDVLEEMSSAFGGSTEVFCAPFTSSNFKAVLICRPENVNPALLQGLRSRTDSLNAKRVGVQLSLKQTMSMCRSLFTFLCGPASIPVVLTSHDTTTTTTTPSPPPFEQESMETKLLAFCDLVDAATDLETLLDAAETMCVTGIVDQHTTFQFCAAMLKYPPDSRHQMMARICKCARVGDLAGVRRWIDVIIEV